jgi:hypothetical protein
MLQVQQLLCDPAQLGRFLSGEESAIVSRHFTGMYSLGKDDLVSGITNPPMIGLWLSIHSKH